MTSYVEHPDVAKRSQDEIDKWISENELTLTGTDIPRPIFEFKESTFPGMNDNFTNIVQEINPFVLRGNCGPAIRQLPEAHADSIGLLVGGTRRSWCDFHRAHRLRKDAWIYATGYFSVFVTFDYNFANLPMLLSPHFKFLGMLSYYSGIIHTIKKAPRLQDEGPSVLVLLPTRELAQQVEEVSRDYCKAMKLNIACLYGGASKTTQVPALRRG